MYLGAARGLRESERSTGGTNIPESEQNREHNP